MRILSFVASYLVAYAVVQLGDDSFFDHIWNASSLDSAKELSTPKTAAT